MGVAHVGLVHRDPCECKVKGFRAVSSIERNVSNRRHLQGVRQLRVVIYFNPSPTCTCRDAPHIVWTSFWKIGARKNG